MQLTEGKSLISSVSKINQSTLHVILMS